MRPDRRKWVLLCILAVSAQCGPGSGSSICQEKRGEGRTEQQRIDVYGDPLPGGAIARLGTVRFRPDGPIDCLAFSPRGSRLAAAGKSNVVQWWDFPSGRRLPHWRVDDGWIPAIAFSPGGEKLASVSANLIRVRDVESGRKLWQYQNFQRFFQALAYSPDGKQLATGEQNGRVAIWDSATGKQLADSFDHREGVSALAYSPTEKVLASGSVNRTVHVRDPLTGKSIHVLRGHAYRVRALAFSSDGKFLASGDGNAPYEEKPETTIKVWAVKTGNELLTIKGHDSGFIWLGFGKDNKTLISVSELGSVRTWNVAKGKEIRKIADRAGPIQCAALSGDRKVLALSGGAAIWFYELDSGKETPQFIGHRDAVQLAAYSVDGKTLSSVGDDAICRTWELSTGREIRQVPNPECSYFPLALSVDAQLLASMQLRDGQAHIWDTATSRELCRLNSSPNSRVFCSAFSPNGKLVAIGDGRISAKKETVLGISVWDLGARKKLWEIDGKDSLRYLFFSPDSEILMWPGPGLTFHRREAVTGAELPRLAFPGDEYEKVAFSPDGKTLAIVGRKSGLVLLEVATGGERLRVPAKGREYNALTISADGQRLATSEGLGHPSSLGASGQNDPTIRVWDPWSGTERAQFHGHEYIVYSLVFSPDGKTLASTSQDTTILIWDLGTANKGTPFSSGNVQSKGQAGGNELSKQLAESFWHALAEGNAPEAFKAIARLIAAGNQAVPYLHERLHAVPPVDAKRITKLIGDLDNDSFETRAAAAAELKKLGEIPKKALEKTLAEKPSAELRKQAEALLSDIYGLVRAGEKLRTLRAIEVLEHIGTPEAREVLKTLAQGAPEARVTREAKASLERLARRARNTP